MSATILELAHQLSQAGKPFVLATVVWREQPTSAQVGAQAIIQPDGQITGWIGGSCTQLEAVREYLRGSGLEESQIARLKAPAGLDIGAATPEEIAASILAELVQVRRRGVVTLPMKETQEQAQDVGAQFIAPDEQEIHVARLPETAIDPVCGMIVEIATARHRSTYDGREFYFCCPACKRLFERNPQEYLVKQQEKGDMV